MKTANLFQIGDRVEAVNNDSRAFGMVGKVVSFGVSSSGRTTYVSKFPSGYEIETTGAGLRKVEEKQSLKSVHEMTRAEIRAEAKALGINTISGKWNHKTSTETLRRKVAKARSSAAPVAAPAPGSKFKVGDKPTCKFAKGQRVQAKSGETFVVDDISWDGAGNNIWYASDGGMSFPESELAPSPAPFRMPEHIAPPWSQGRLLDTEQTRRWSQSERAHQDEKERCQVFAWFSLADQGRGRKRVCVCDTPEDAAFIASLPAHIAARDAEVERLTAALKDTCEMSYVRTLLNDIFPESGWGDALDIPANFRRIEEKIDDLEERLQTAIRYKKEAIADCEKLRARVKELEARICNADGIGNPSCANVGMDRIDGRLRDLKAQNDKRETERDAARAALTTMRRTANATLMAVRSELAEERLAIHRRNIADGLLAKYPNVKEPADGADTKEG